MSSGRRLDLDRYRRVKNRSSPPSTNTTTNTGSSLTPTNTNKKVMTWKELESTLSKSDTKKLTPVPKKTPRTPSRSQVSVASPLSQRIRQQILKTHDEKPYYSTPARITTTTTPLVSERRKRMEQNQHRVLTPTTSTTTTTPIRTTPKATAALRVSAPPLASPMRKTLVTTPKAVVAAKTTAKKTMTTRLSPKKAALTPPLAPRSAVRNKRPAVTPPRTPLGALKNNSAAASAASPDTGGANNTRRNLDKRSARLRYSNEFSTEIAKFRDSPSSPPGVVTTTTTTLSPPPSSGTTAVAAKADGISIFVRKRPMFPHETAAGDFDVVGTAAAAASAQEEQDVLSERVVVYKTQMHADMKTKQVQAVYYNCTAFFDETADSDQVYAATTRPLVLKACAGGVATLLMFGQTGSGKTYTMTAMEEHCALEIFETAGTTVQVSFLELSGKVCRDLVNNAGTEVRIMDKDNGSVCFVNASSVEVTTPQELAQVIGEAKQRRATQATDKNDVSSRSHAVCQLTILNKSSSRRGGVLTLVDCAGTERKNDSMYHSRSRQDESTEINASLYALKECIRAKSSRRRDKHVPYRSHNLTRVLRESLERPDAQLTVIATVAPNATDTEHTLHTLKTITTLSGGAPEEGRLQKLTPIKSGEQLVAPKKWNHENLVKWLVKKRLVKTAVPENVDGRMVMRMSKLQLRITFYDDEGGDKAELLFKCLRAETDRVARLDLKRRMNKA